MPPWGPRPLLPRVRAAARRRLPSNGVHDPTMLSGFDHRPESRPIFCLHAWAAWTQDCAAAPAWRR